MKIPQQYDTDKIQHNYFDFYNSVFESIDNVKSVLEIGIYKGGSLDLLADIFPKANIFGIDIHDKTHLEFNHSSRIKTYIGDQSNRSDLKKIIDTIDTQFDIIIDDGGHMMNQQQISLGYLFQFVSPGGLYILEDLHTSNISSFIEANDSITSLEMLHNFNSNGKITSNHLLPHECLYLDNNIKSIDIWSVDEFYQTSVTSAIYKKQLSL